MVRVFTISIVFCLLISIEAQSQSSVQSAATEYSYYPPKQDKESWQRLNLLLSSTFINVCNEGQIDLDSSLYLASRSIGLGKYSILAEGLNDPELFSQSQWIDRRDPANGILLLANATGKKHIQSLLLLGAYYAFQPGNSTTFRDSAAYFLNQAIRESKALKEARLGRQALCLLGKIYVQANDQKGDSIYNLLINQCRQAGDKETEARALAYRSRYTPPTGATILRKLTDTQKAAELFHTLKNTEGEINALTDAGYLLVITGQLPQAREIFHQALNLADSIHFPYTHYNAQALSMVTLFQGKFGEPLLYTLQMIKTSENCRDSIGWGYFHHSLAELLFSEGRYKESLEVIQRATDRFVIDRNPTVFNLLVELIDNLNEEGKPDEALALTVDISNKVKKPSTFSDQYSYQQAFAACYLNLNKLAEAEMHIKKMDSVETLAEGIRGPLRRSGINYYYAVLFFKKGQYLKAREYFEKQFTSPTAATSRLTNQLSTCRWLITVDSVLGDKASAISHYKRYNQLLDSNFKVTKIRQAEELQIMYQTKDKENQIASLTHQAKLEKAASAQAVLVKNLTFAGAIAVIIIAGLLYRQNRLKQRSNEVISLKNMQLLELLGAQERLVKDKEWLLKEIHHRVKNNLQIVMSLLNSQSVFINNDAALAAIHDSERRVHAMALIHQKLYQAENISTIAMPEYINELVTYVQDSFDSGNRIVFRLAIEVLNLDVSQAIPLGLIINESIVNSIKYAFPNERKGIVDITLRKDGTDHLLLEISDNGIGLAKDLDISQLNSLGLDLMQGLAKQLNGSFAIENQDGLHIRIRFPNLNSQLSGINLVNA